MVRRTIAIISILIISTLVTDTLGFLMSDVSRLMRRRFDERARRIGVTRAQWRALTTLSRCEGIQQSGLAELLEVEPITLCRMLDRLADAGLIERRRDPADRRAWRIHLTEQARPLLIRLRSIADELFSEALEGFAAPDQARLHDDLSRIRFNLGAAELDKETAHG